MSRPWQEKVAVHHINGDSRDNSPENLSFVHLSSRQPLSDAELGAYQDWLLRRAGKRA